jgi:hypothetical protein
VVEAEDGTFVGPVAGLRDVVTFEAATYAEIEAAFRTSVHDYLAFCAERGEPPERSVIEPAPARSLLAVLRSLGPLEEDLGPVEELPHTPVEV